MKPTSLLTACVLSLATVAGVSAQEVKFSIPNSNSAPAPQTATDKVASEGVKAQEQATASAAAAPFTDVQLSEEFGWFVGKRLGLSDLEFTPAEAAALAKGLQAAALDKDAPYELEKAGPLMDKLMQTKQANYMAKLKMQSLNEAAAFFKKLDENKNVVALPDGLRYEILQQGSGDFPKPTDTVKVHYTGKLLNGEVFDTSHRPTQDGSEAPPTEISLQQVIPGWVEGLQKINKGGKIRLYIPPQLAYGDSGQGHIPPGATLIFDIDLIDIIPGTATNTPAPGGGK